MAQRENAAAGSATVGFRRIHQASLTMDERIFELVQRWEAAWLSGSDVPVEELCIEHPECATIVGQKIASLKEMNRFLEIGPRLPRDSTVGTDHTPLVYASGNASSEVSTTSHYKILQSYARGGLGEILVASDLQIGRKVAIKVIQAGIGKDEHRQQRFLREASITAQLEHPGIVPVHGIGCDEYGSPCYAMRLVEGETLSESIARYHRNRDQHAVGKQNLALRKLLQHFISVCNTVAFAHQHGVLHRDIKPSNILVGPFGETLIIDWGLAKKFNCNLKEEPHQQTQPQTEERRTATDVPPQKFAPTLGGVAELEPIPVCDPLNVLTKQGGILGTPYFMSPEQAMGGEAVTQRSDVYSLGATLYALICGTYPYGNTDPSAVLSEVRRGNVTPPIQVNRSVPKPLNAICLRAMALEPSGRYASALELASDIEKWMADEPVTAYPDQWMDRWMRWTRQHRLAVSACSAAGGMAVISLAVLLATVSHSNRKLSIANAKEAAATQHALSQQKIATTNAALADEQSGLARSVLQEVIERIQRDLRNVPAANQIRRDILQRSMVGLAAVSQSLESRPTMDRMKMLAYRDLGDVYGLIGDDLGRSVSESAYQQFHASMIIAESLAKTNPTDRQAQIDLAAIYRRVGNSLLELKSAREAEEYLQKQMIIMEGLAEAEPQNLETQLSLVSSVNALGDYYFKERSFEKAASAYEQAFQIVNQLAASHPDLVLENREYVVSVNNLGELRSRQGKHSEAIAYFEQSLSVNRQRWTATPDDVQVLQDLAYVLFALGGAFAAQGEFTQVEPFYQEALQIRTRLHAMDPSNISWERQLMQSHEKVGDLTYKLHRLAAAKVHFDAMLDICRRHATTDSASKSVMRDLSVALKKLGDFHWENKEPETALRYFQEALDSDRARSQKDETDPRIRVDIAVSLSNLATKLMQLDREKEAVVMLQESASLYRNHYRANLADAKAARNMSVILSQLGAAHRRLNEFEQARICNDESLSMNYASLKDNPKSVSLRLDLISALHARGILEKSATRHSDAKEWFQKALTVVGELESEKQLVGRDVEWREYIEADLEDLRKATTP
jgi:serine/threonine-protein kinase